MSAEIKALNRRFNEEVINQQNLSAVDALVAEGIVDHIPLRQDTMRLPAIWWESRSPDDWPSALTAGFLLYYNDDGEAVVEPPAGGREFLLPSEYRTLLELLHQRPLVDEAQCSTIWPSRTRTKSAPSTEIAFPVAGMPMNSPRCVPVILTTWATTSPSANSPMTSIRRSGNATKNAWRAGLMPSRPGPCPGPLVLYQAVPRTR